MSYSAFEIWGLIVLMGIGTYLIRFSFLGWWATERCPNGSCGT